MSSILDQPDDEALQRMRGGSAWWLGLIAEGRAQANFTTVLPFDGPMHGLQDIFDRKVTGKLVVKTGTAV